MKSNICLLFISSKQTTHFDCLQNLWFFFPFLLNHFIFWILNRVVKKRRFLKSSDICIIRFMVNVSCLKWSKFAENIFFSQLLYWEYNFCYWYFLVTSVLNCFIFGPILCQLGIVSIYRNFENCWSLGQNQTFFWPTNLKFHNPTAFKDSIFILNRAMKVMRWWSLMAIAFIIFLSNHIM